MESIYSIFFLICALLAGFLIIGGVIFLIVKLTRAKNEEKKPLKITINLLFKIYLYIISFITLVVAVYGGALLIKSGGSYLFGIPFGYNLYEPYYYSDAYYKEDAVPALEEEVKCYGIEEKMQFGDHEICFDQDTRKQDLINGATFFASMLIIFGLHQFALYRLEKRSSTTWLKKIYTFISLTMYSIIGVIIIPTAIYQLTTHLLYRVNDVTSYDEPGTAIGVMIMTLPLWIYFLVKATRMKDED